MSPAPEQIERLLDWTARLRADMTAMPWAEPPEQPSAFDRRDIEEAEDFDRLMAARDLGSRYAQGLTPVTDNPHLFPLRRCGACGYRVNAPGHRSMCGGAA